MGPSAAWFYEGQLRLHRNWIMEKNRVEMLNGNGNVVEIGRTLLNVTGEFAFGSELLIQFVHVPSSRRKLELPIFCGYYQLVSLLHKTFCRKHFCSDIMLNYSTVNTHYFADILSSVKLIHLFSAILTK